MTIELALLSRVSYRGQEITSPRLGGLLALLADDLRTGCGTARLVEGLWPDTQPENPAKALQVLVSRARAQLGSDVIAGTPIGYRLTLDEDQVDAAAVLLSASASARHSRAGDHEAALSHAEAGLALWAGPASWDANFTDPLSTLRAARASTYRSLARTRALTLSRLGRPAEAIDVLTDLLDERPRDEEVLLEVMRCEAATAGPSAALARYDGYRRALRDELGSDPGAALQSLHQRLLQGEAPAVRQGVLHEPNPLLGRDEDIAAVAGLLRTARVTSIVGPGGLGKTRLAHVVSRQAEQRVVHFVTLAGVTSDDDVVGEVASVLGAGESATVGGDVVAGIVTALGPALLVLDNCEHVVRGAADLVQTLVSLSKDLRVLTTSRTPLGLSSESVYLLPELSLPTAVALFGHRARAARPDVELPAEIVQELCSHLDGLPLAVELAAARVRVMSVAEMARRLDDRFTLLRGGARDAPPRHHTLHAVIDWSWNLLGSRDQAAMRAFSVFPDGFTADAAQHLLDDDILEVLGHLAGHSLLKVNDTRSGTRFRMLETVREFSTARREEAGETGRLTDRFLAWARDFGIAHHDSLFGADLAASMARIGAERDNLVLALRYGLDREDGATVAATSAALACLWTFESNFTRMATLVGDTAWVLSHYRPEPDLVEATRTASALSAVNGFLLQRPQPLRALATLRRLPPPPPGTLAGATQAVLHAITGGSGSSALFPLCDNEDPLLAGMANGVVSYVWENLDDPDRALSAAKRMADAFDDRETPWMRAVAHARAGELCLQLERGEEARQELTAALSVLDELGTWSGAARVRGALVLANLQVGDTDEAEHWLEQAMRGGEEATGTSMVEFAARAEILLARGEVEAGLRRWRQTAEQLRNTDRSEELGAEAWNREIQAMTVIAHAQHGRLDLVEEITRDLPRTLREVITDPAPSDPVCGVLLLALAMADLGRGDPAATEGAVRMIALAERFRFVRGFHPTMSSARAKACAEQADRSAYADAVSSYADLDRDALRAAALAALDQLTAPDPA